MSMNKTGTFFRIGNRVEEVVIYNEEVGIQWIYLIKGETRPMDSESGTFTPGQHVFPVGKLLSCAAEYMYHE